MKLGLIGTFIRDHIVFLDGREMNSIGGLYHSLANAAFLAPDSLEIIPVARVGEDFIDEIREMIHRLPGVSAERLLVSDQPNTCVRLEYRSANRRDEISTRPMTPLTFDEIACLAEADAVLVNMITGEDVELAAVRQLRRNGPPIYFDLHTMVLARDAEGRRYPRVPENWRQWLEAVDFLQMNQEEAGLLAGLAVESEISNFRAFAEELLTGRQLRGVHITLGEKGALCGRRNDQGEVEIRHLPAPTDIRVNDIIGCGDAYGAAFVVSYLQQPDFFAAAEFAVKIASLNTVFPGSIDAEKFETYVRPHANPET